MSKTKPTVLESFKLAEKLLEEIKQQQNKNQFKKGNYHPPKWLLGNETWYSPNKKEDK